MEFSEIVVKDNPGLCRCCLSEGCYKDMGSDYTWMNETEIYADMLLECFDISISQHNEGPNGPNRLICEVCITRLRDACYFKKQVLDSEKKFVDMVGRGEFKSKVVVYQTQMKAETAEEAAARAEDTDGEYLDDDMAFVDDELDQKHDESEVAASSVTADPLPVRNKRGRPKKATTTKSTKKKVKVEKNKNKALVKGQLQREEPKTRQRLNVLRRNILLLIHYSNMKPFRWHTKGFSCFYCSMPVKDCAALDAHYNLKHKKEMDDLDIFIQNNVLSKDFPLKMDVSNISCKYCPNIEFARTEDLIDHVILVHNEDYDQTAGISFLPFRLSNDIMDCVLCDEQFDNFTTIMSHMYRQHVTHCYMCQTCGLSFINIIKLNRHIKSVHVGYKCTVCKKLFTSYNKLSAHKSNIHGKVVTRCCELCSASFKSAYQLKVHMGKEHNVEKYKIQCEYCPKICTTKGAMLTHVQSLHSDEKYECDLCDYKASTQWLVKLHKRKHFGQKDYTCSVCERKFARSSNVRAHMKVHTGQIGKVCRWCRFGFISSETLEKHTREAHLERD